MGDRSPVLQWERRGGLKRSGGLEWAGAIAGLEQGLIGSLELLHGRKRRPGREGPEISKQLTLSGNVSLLESKRERRHLLDRRGKMKCTYLKSSSELLSATTLVE